MEINKILVVDFVNKKVTSGYVGPSGQTFVPLISTTEIIESRKRVTEAIERIDKLIEDMALLNKKEE
jgi:hypothetical protein